MKKSKVPAKYANPTDPVQTWTGRGRKPAWVNDFLTSGKTLDDLMIKQEIHLGSFIIVIESEKLL